MMITRTLLLLLLLTPTLVQAMSTAFTYQGRLVQTGAAPTGSFDFQFSLYDAATDGSQVGTTVDAAGVPVIAGLFTVALDFGAPAFSGDDRWLAITVRAAGGGSYVPLTPRQPLTPTPYALFARGVRWADITGRPETFGVYQAGAGMKLVGNTFSIDYAGTGSATTAARSDHTQQWSSLVNVPGGFNDGVDDNTTYSAGPGMTLTGTIFTLAYAGTGSADSPARSDHHHDATYWKQGGNNFTDVGVLGTLNTQPIEIKVNSARVMRLEPSGLCPNVILGFFENSVTGDAFGGTISGGGYSSMPNTINGGSMSTIAGGYDNEITAAASVIGGGAGNAVSAQYGVIAGGQDNTQQGQWGTIGGGKTNTVTGTYGTVPGGYGCTAGGHTSFAAGYLANAAHNGSFVWNDTYAGSTSSTGTDQFIVRATGGIWLGTYPNTPSIPAGRFINTSSGAYLSGGGTWTNSCDRNLKTDFTAVNRRTLLEKLAALPITDWRYKTGEGAARHLGPTAQDFRAAFGLGLDDTSISTVDGIGVALAAIQGLQQELKDRDRKIDRQQAEIDRLRAEMEALMAMVKSLANDRTPAAKGEMR